MAAPTFLDGPYLKGFDGLFDIGAFSGYIQLGRCKFVTTAQTADIPLRSGGLTGAPIVLTSYNSADKTLTWTISGTTITFTRSDSTSALEFDVVLIYLS